METENKIQTFLKKHNFSTQISDNLHDAILSDMKKGLEKGNADQAMIRAGKAVIRNISKGENAIIIDAGGTNFRSCLVTKTEDGIEVSDFQRTSMPAIDRELSKKEFYKAIADNISRLKDKSDKISFCFSYAMEITEDGDGKILRFSKEVKAQDAVGSYIGKELCAELKKQGWKKIQKISVLNDTSALLLSSFTDSQKNWKSRIAFILGTGMNSAYILHNRIIVTECGMFNSIPQSLFDITVDNHTSHPGLSILEKMCSGVYLGEIAYQMIKTACDEGLFSDNFADEAAKLPSISTMDFDGLFIKGKETKLTELLKHGTQEDSKILITLITAIITRSANLTAETIYSAVVSADKEKEELPICITCNGSTFWKTPLLKETVEECLKDLLQQPFEIIQIDDDITKGSFAAAFIN